MLTEPDELVAKSNAKTLDCPPAVGNVSSMESKCRPRASSPAAFPWLVLKEEKDTLPRAHVTIWSPRSTVRPALENCRPLAAYNSSSGSSAVGGNSMFTFWATVALVLPVRLSPQLNDWTTRE